MLFPGRSEDQQHLELVRNAESQAPSQTPPRTPPNLWGEAPSAMSQQGLQGFPVPEET